MNILFLDQFSDLGGAQRCLLELLPAVVERGWQAHLAAPGEGRLCEGAHAVGATVHTIPCGPYNSGRKSWSDLLHFAGELPRLAEDIGRLAGRSSAELLYVNGPRLLPAAAWAMDKLKPVPVLFHCHSYLSQRYAAWLAGQALRRAQAMVVGSCRFVLRPLRRYLVPGRVHVVYNGVAAGKSQAGHPRRDREGAISGNVPRIGVIGRIAPEKGQAEFLRAARHIPAARFMVCGSPLFSDPHAAEYMARLRSLADGLPVEFLGWCDDVYSVLSELDLLVVPSMSQEATTRVILEAYAANVPVVAFRSGGIPEVLTDGETGFLVGDLRPEALAEKIRDLIGNSPEKLAQAAQRAQARWREQFTLARYQQQMIEIMEQARCA